MTWKTTNTAKGDNKLYSDAKGVVPSLDLRFAEGKTLNDHITGQNLITFSRDVSSGKSAGTYVGSDGLIKTAKVNLLTYSNNIGPGKDGFSTNATTVTENADTAPDNTTTATRISSDVGFALVSANVTSGVDYVFSFYAKTSSDTSWTIGTQSNPFVDKIVTVVPGEWTRVELAFTATATTSQQFRFVKGGGLTGDILVWGVQLEEGATPTALIPTQGTSSGAPRFDHDPANNNASLGLLIEESRTNYIDNSTTLSFPFINGLGTGISPVVTTQTAVGPDGISASVTRCQFDRGTGNTINDFSLVAFTPTTPSANYSESVWLKSNDNNDYVIIVYDAGGAKGDEFTVTPEWQRFTLDANTSYKNSSDAVTTSPNLLIGLRNDPGNSVFYAGNTNSQTADILVWGPQIENGTFVTSYVPTSGTAVTRAADVASITGTNFSSWYNQSAGTVFVGAQAVESGSLQYLLHAYGISGTNNRGAYYLNGSNRPSAYWLNAGTTAALLQSPTPTLGFDGASFKYVAAYDTDDFVLGYDGGNLIFDTSGSSDPTINTATIGSFSASASFLNGHISRLTYFPERLPDATLQAITQ